MFSSWLLALIYVTSATITFGHRSPLSKLKHPLPIEPQTKSVQMPEITREDLSRVFQIATENAKKRADYEEELINEGMFVNLTAISFDARNQDPASPKTMQLHRTQENLEDVNRLLTEMFNLTKDQVLYGLPELQLPNDIPLLETCQSLKKVEPCDESSPFRTADGTCNNLNHMEWGSVETCYGHMTTFAYADSISSPRVSEEKTQLPNPRHLSTEIATDVNRESPTYSHMLVHMAQFTAHDVAQTSMPSPADGVSGTTEVGYKCCPINATHAPACYSFSIPKDDKFYKDSKRNCLSFLRNSACPKDCKLGRQREQVSQQTAYIDASVIYGTSKEETDVIRTFKNGLLDYQEILGPNGVEMLLPPSLDQVNDHCTKDMDPPSNPKPCFHAGDGRVNFQPGLTIMHTVWFRWHNFIAQYLTDGTMEEETQFQTTKHIVAATMQNVVYQELLPLLLGSTMTDIFDLRVKTKGFTSYNKTVDPTVVLEFSAAAFRVGHTLVQNLFTQVDQNGNPLESLQLQDYMFHPMHLYQGKMDALVRGLSQDGSQSYDQHFVTGLTDHLFQRKVDKFGLDLVAINIQRGRENGLPGYVELLKFCYDVEIKEFNDLISYNFMTMENVRILEKNYKHLGDVDAYLAGVMEIPLPDSLVGPTFGCYIANQFQKLKFGDRFYYEHGGQTGSFSEAQLTEIRKVTLASIFCDTTKVGQIQPQVLRTISPTNPLINCSNIPRPNLDLWMKK